MVRRSFSDEVRAVIDPVVVPHGFASGQGDGAQVVFCASLDELAARVPRLPQAGEQQSGPGACVDLVVTGDGQMNLASVELEGVPLDEMLRHVGLAGVADELRSAMDGDRTHALNGVRPHCAPFWPRRTEDDAPEQMSQASSPGGTSTRCSDHSAGSFALHLVAEVLAGTPTQVQGRVRVCP